jgi:hypothetical protein
LLIKGGAGRSNSPGYNAPAAFWNCGNLLAEVAPTSASQQPACFRLGVAELLLVKSEDNAHTCLEGSKSNVLPTGCHCVALLSFKPTLTDHCKVNAQHAQHKQLCQGLTVSLTPLSHDVPVLCNSSNFNVSSVCDCRLTLFSAVKPAGFQPSLRVAATCSQL